MAPEAAGGLHLCVLGLCVFSACAAERPELAALARFRGDAPPKLAGEVRLERRLEGTAVELRLDRLLNGSSAYIVHTHPCDVPGAVFDPLGQGNCTCSLAPSALPTGCAVGAQSARFGALGGHREHRWYTDPALNLTGVHGALGRSVVVHEPDSSSVCANLTTGHELALRAPLVRTGRNSSGSIGFLELRDFEHTEHSAVHVVLDGAPDSGGPFLLSLHEPRDSKSKAAGSEAGCGEHVLGSQSGSDCSEDRMGPSDKVAKCALGRLDLKHGTVPAGERRTWGDVVGARRANGKDVQVTGQNGTVVACGRLQPVRWDEQAPESRHKAWGIELEVSRPSFFFGLVLAFMVGGSILVYAGRRASRHCRGAAEGCRTGLGSLFGYNKLDKQEREVEL
jgi:hypothetical protein